MISEPALPRFARPRCRLGGVPVLVYHGLSNLKEVGAPSPELKYSVLSSQFRAHLGRISQTGHRVVLLRELWTRASGYCSVHSDVVLTFDDGRLSDYDVGFPLLLAMGVKAEFFVNTVTVGRRGFLSWDQIVEMQRAGMSFQSHGHHHVDLTRLSTRELLRQLQGSKTTLEDRLGSPVEFLAAPYGYLSAQVLETAGRVGYRAVCSTRSLPARPGAQVVNRVVVYRHASMHDFDQLLERNPLYYLGRVARAPFYWPKRLLVRFRPAPAEDSLFDVEA